MLTWLSAGYLPGHGTTRQITSETILVITGGSKPVIPTADCDPIGLGLRTVSTV